MRSKQNFCGKNKVVETPFRERMILQNPMISMKTQIKAGLSYRRNHKQHHVWSTDALKARKQ